MRMRLLFVYSLLLAGTLHAQTSDINEKLAGHFPFSNCTGTDASANGSTATLGSDAQCDCGVRDSSLVFNGSEDAVFFTGRVSDVFTTSNFTVSFYMKPGQPPVGLGGAVQMIMSKQEDCSSNKAFWVRYRRQGQTAQSSNILSTGISQNDTMLVTLKAQLDENRCWYHVTIVRDGTRFALYVDGVKQDEKFSTVRLDISNNASLSLSEPKCPLDTVFYGQLDEFRFYNRAYSTADINSLLSLYPDKIVNNDTLLYLGNSLNVFTTPSCATAFSWMPTDGVSDPTVASPVLTPLEPTTYISEWIFADGCIATDTLRINVIDPDTLDCSKIFIPNAFTPGFSRGRNDRFLISNPYAISEFISFEVFDRWGGRMFNAESVTDSWDGTFGGKPVNPGVFLYRLRFRCQNEERVLSGTVTLLR